MASSALLLVAVVPLIVFTVGASAQGGDLVLTADTDTLTDQYAVNGENVSNVVCHTNESGFWDIVMRTFLQTVNSTANLKSGKLYQTSLQPSSGYRLLIISFTFDTFAESLQCGSSSGGGRVDLNMAVAIGPLQTATKQGIADSLVIRGIPGPNATYDLAKSQLLPVIIPRFVCTAHTGGPTKDLFNLNISFTNGTMLHIGPRSPPIIIPTAGSIHSSGQYLCTAGNRLNPTLRRLEVNLAVHDRPQLATANKSHRVNRGSHLVLNCTVTALPRLTVLTARAPNGTVWDLFPGLSDGAFPLSPRQVTVVDVPSATLADQGTYSCFGTNDVGNTTLDIDVTVHDVPGPPVGEQVGTTGLDFLIVTWRPPADNAERQPKVIDYDIQCSTGTGSGTPEHTSGGSTAALAIGIAGLRPGSLYTCFVRARNALGFGPAVNVSGRLEAPTMMTPTVRTAVTTVDILGHFTTSRLQSSSAPLSSTLSSGLVTLILTSIILSGALAVSH